jgi:hypothetical protein
MSKVKKERSYLQWEYITVAQLDEIRQNLSLENVYEGPQTKLLVFDIPNRISGPSACKESRKLGTR